MEFCHHCSAISPCPYWMSISLRSGSRSAHTGRAPSIDAAGVPTMKIIRYADDFCVMVHGTRADADALWDEIAAVLAPMGLRLSAEKSRSATSTRGSSFSPSVSGGKRRGARPNDTYIRGRRRRLSCPSPTKSGTLTRRHKHRTLTDLLRRPTPFYGWCNIFSTECPNAPSATSTTSHGGGWSPGCVNGTTGWLGASSIAGFCRRARSGKARRKCCGRGKSRSLDTGTGARK